MRLQRAFAVAVLLALGVACSSPAAPVPPTPAAAPATSAAPAAQPSPAASASASPSVAPAVSPVAVPSASPVAAGSLTTVKIAQAPGVGNSPAYLADAKGYFREQGIQAEFVRVGSSPELQQLVSTGDAQIGFGGLSAAFFNGLARDLDMRIIAGNYQTDPEGDSQLPIVARKASVDSGAIKTVADLKGKKVAVNGKGAGTEYELDLALRTGGITINDVDLTTLGYPEMVAGLANGGIEGAIILEPTASKAVSSGAGVKLVPKYGAGTQNAVMLGNYKWAQANRDLMRRTLVAWLKGVADVQNGGWRSDANIALLQPYTDASAADLLASGVPYWPADGQVNTADLMKQEQFFRDRGYITYPSPLPEDKLEDLSFLQAARQSLGR